MILTLDLATRFGWCRGIIGALPVFGARDLGRNRSNGEVLDDYFSWLWATIDEIQPSVVAFESPYMPTGPNNPFAAPANALTIRRLFAFAGVTELICRRRRVRCLEARPSEITRAFLGGPAPRGRDKKKAATVAMCHRLGFDVADDDEGDALALWMYAEGVFQPAMISRRRAGVGLELDLHSSQTKSAPRGLPRSAQTISDGRSNNGPSDKGKNNLSARQLQFATG